MASVRPYKILLIGETGSGKTSFLNFLCNGKMIEELGKEFDAAKFEQIKCCDSGDTENATDRPMASKTDQAKSYHDEAEIYGMKVTVIDTPGFGDSRGIETDKVNVKKIIDALKSEKYVNCVCLIINGRSSRMTASLQYVLNEVSAIMPQEVFNNIIVVFTNTASALDCHFDMRELDGFFGKKIDRALYIDNPYCKIEKVKQKPTQLTDKDIKGLRESFEDGTECLCTLQETIKGFEEVHTLHFTKLFDAKQEIERDVITILTFYDNQTELEKKIKIKEEEVDAALRSKSLNTKFKETSEVEVVKPVPTSDKRHNTLCGVPRCYSNCHIPCNLPKSYNQEDFKSCAAMGGTETCKVCGHSYRHHYHNEIMFQKVMETKEFVDEAMKKKFKEAADMEQRAKYMRQGLQTQREELLRKKNSLLQELNGKITEFQKLGISNQNYAKVLEKQLDVVKLRIEAATGDERAQLDAFKDVLEKKLKVVNSAITGQK